MLNIELVALLTMLSYKSLIGIWLQLPARRGAILDWAVEIPPFFFCIKAYGWLQLLISKMR